MTKKQRQQQQGRQIMRGVFAACERCKRRRQRERMMRGLQILSAAIETAIQGWKRLMAATHEAIERASVAAKHYGTRRKFTDLLQARAHQLENQ